MASPAHTAVKAVVLDLDGTLLDTEALCAQVGSEVLGKFNVTLTPQAVKACIGKRPLESWQTIVDELGLASKPLEETGGEPLTAQRLYSLSEPLLRDRWCEVRLLPGALRLIKHLAASGIPYVVATSTPRASLEAKLSTKPEMKELLRLAVCGDEVENGKPAPDTFLAAARLLGVPQGEEGSCLVVEDAPTGVQGALAASMQVLFVPSQPGLDKEAALPGVTAVPSLLAWHPSDHGLPPFTDTIHDAIPMDTPLFIKGEVVHGFGRGSKELGIPTANITGKDLVDSLVVCVTGIMAGWASMGTCKEVHPFVCSIGYNPFFGDLLHKTAEAWILDAGEQLPSEFYHEELRLVVVAYIRPELSNFPNLQALIDRIHEDANVTRKVLQHPCMLQWKGNAWLQPGDTAAQLAHKAALAASQKAEAAKGPGS